MQKSNKNWQNLNGDFDAAGKFSNLTQKGLHWKNSILC
jgi:hypothetical protein